MDNGGTRNGSSQLFERRPPRILEWLLRLPTYLFRFRLGWLLGHKLLLLKHRGRKTGKIRETVLEVLRYDPNTRECVVLSAWGERADWYLNIRASPPLELAIADQRYTPTYRVLPQAEAYEVFTVWEHGHRWGPAALQGLLKIDVDRSEAARRAFTESLVFVSFVASH
jgi:deazaflavin-dependent oxidoreductase (nitroreductase family)